MEQAQQVASTDSTVLLLGETGTGKELIASHIHDLSARHGRLMVRVNCSAIPSTLMESELFGREKGAFTGALARQIGRFELAERSTIFLDEIGDLPGEVQVKLLRVLEERKIERLGSPKPIPVDVRIIAATHRNLEKRIAEDAFREDLFYRLNVFPIHIPPLRDRVEDIPLLVWRFVDEFSKVFSKRSRCDLAGRHGGAATARLARQHSRAAECGRTRDDRVLRRPVENPPAGRPFACRGQAEHQAERRRKRAHPRRIGEHRLADSRIGWRGRLPRASADHARGPNGQIGPEPAETSIASEAAPQTDERHARYGSASLGQCRFAPPPAGRENLTQLHGILGSSFLVGVGARRARLRVVGDRP